MSDRIKTLTALALLAIAFAGGWLVQGWRMSSQIADLKLEHSEQALAMADAAKQIGIKANAAISEADQRAWKGLENDKAELRRLRGCVADGTCGVRLITKYIEQPTESTGNSATSSLGYDTVALDPDVQRRVLDLKEAIDEDRAKIEYLQEYARHVWEKLQEGKK